MTSGLATLVAGIWTEAGYETTISHRDGETYVLAEHESGRYDLLWVLDPGADLTVEGVERYRERIADLDVADAYAVTAAAVDDEVARRAARHGIEAVGVETLRELAADSGVGQDAVDAALATTVGADEAADGDDGDRAETAIGGDPSDPDTQAEIRRRLGVMIGEVEPDEDPDAADNGGDDGPVPAAGAGERVSIDLGTGDGDGADGGDGAAGAGDGGTDDGDGGDGADDDPLATGDDDGDFGTLDDADLPGGSDLPGDDSGGAEADDDGGRLSRRGVVTGGVAAVLSAGVLDFAVFNVVLGGGGGGLPAYNETRVKAEATSVPPDAVLATPEQWVDEPLTYDPAVVETVEKSGGLWSVTFAVDGGRIVGRWDGDEPTVGRPYAVWGVVTGTTTVGGSEVPQLDVVDMTTGRGGGGTTSSGGTASGGTTTAGG
jgi:hypothetical protein